MLTGKNHEQDDCLYIRTSCDKQDLNNQKLEILEYARKKDIKVDDFIEQDFRKKVIKS